MAAAAQRAAGRAWPRGVLRLGRGAVGRLPLQRGLHCCQGGGDGLRESLRPRGCAARSRAVARWPSPRRAFRWGASARCRMWSQRSATCCRRRRPTSPAASSMSTAATGCNEWNARHPPPGSARAAAGLARAAPIPCVPSCVVPCAVSCAMTSDLKRALEHLRLRAAVRRSCATLAGWLAHGAGLSLVLMMLHVTLVVLLKYFFKLPIPGTAEVVAAYYMIGVVFLPLAYIEVHGRPIMVEVFYDRLPQRLQAPLDVLGSALSLGFYAFLAWQSTKMACAALESGEYIDGLWQVVVWPSRFLIPSGLLLACAAMLLRLAVLLQGGRAGHGGDCAEPL